jgi:hypothetical protein
VGRVLLGSPEMQEVDAEEIHVFGVQGEEGFPHAEIQVGRVGALSNGYGVTSNGYGVCACVCIRELSTCRNTGRACWCPVCVCVCACVCVCVCDCV